MTCKAHKSMVGKWEMGDGEVMDGRDERSISDYVVNHIGSPIVYPIGKKLKYREKRRRSFRIIRLEDSHN